MVKESLGSYSVEIYWVFSVKFMSQYETISISPNFMDQVFQRFT